MLRALSSCVSGQAFVRHSSKLAFGRSTASKWPRPKPGTAERPPYRAPDPLLNNPKARVTELPEDGMTFIHRPPPSAPSPFSLTTNPVSPLLRPKAPSSSSTAAAEVRLPPLLKTHKELPRASGQTMSEIKRLRNLDPNRYTTSVLARKFQVTRGFVQSIAALKKSTRKAKRREQEAIAAKSREKWSERRTLTNMIRTKRRELWW